MTLAGDLDCRWGRPNNLRLLGPGCSIGTFFLSLYTTASKPELVVRDTRILIGLELLALRQGHSQS